MTKPVVPGNGMDLLRIASRVASAMESVYMSIQIPPGMSEDEAVGRAKALIPCETGEWYLVDDGTGWYSGNMECGAGFYDVSDGGSYGPDDAGVSVTWEKP